MTQEERDRLGNLEPMHLLAITIYGEARGEDILGKIAVAWTVLNRVKDKRWGDTVARVVLQPWQFSCWNEKDPNFPVLIRKSREGRFADKEISWRECQLAAYAVLCGWVRDVTNGANHYHVVGLHPSWSDPDKWTLTHNHHVFYKL